MAEELLHTPGADYQDSRGNKCHFQLPSRAVMGRHRYIISKTLINENYNLDEMAFITVQPLIILWRSGLTVGCSIQT